MRVLFVSTWGSSCGIATYTEELIEESGELWESFVSGPAEGGSGIRKTPPVPYYQHWHRDGANLDQSLLAAVNDFGPDIVHVQHEYGLFQESSAFLRAMHVVKKRVPVVVTLHTVNWSGSWEHTLWFRDLGQCVNAIVVHLPEAMASVGLFAPNTFYIPHGTGPFLEGSRERGIEALRLSESTRGLIRSEKCPPVCVLYGFMGAGKNLLCTIRAIAIAEARKLCDSVLLFLVGEVCEELFFGQVRWLLNHTGLELRTTIYPTFLPVQNVPHVLSLADFGVLNTTSWSLSASGAAHVYARYGVPIAVANRPIYYEAMRGGALAFDLASNAVDPTDSAVDVIAALTSNLELRRQVEIDMRVWADQTRWPLIAKQHLDLYNRIMKGSSNAVTQ